MTGPTFSPDGNWMWNGNEWIPAPPKSDVLPSSAINQGQIQSVAASSGVIPSQLNSVAPYFDQNRDGILQQNELQQAAMSISTPPVSSAPQQQPMMHQQQPVVQQQPMMQQMTQPYQQMAQPARQQVVIVKQEKSSNKIIPWIGVGLIIFSIFMPYVSILGFDVTGMDMISFMGDSPFAEEAEEGCLDSYGNEVDCDDTDDDSSSSNMESDELALVIALFMLFFSPLVFLLVAVISAIILGVGGSSRVMGTLHLTYAIIFVICGLLSPSALGISIFDFIGFGFYMGALAGLFLVVE